MAQENRFKHLRRALKRTSSKLEGNESAGSTFIGVLVVVGHGSTCIFFCFHRDRADCGRLSE